MQSFNKNMHVKMNPYRIILDKKRYIVEHLQNGEFYEMPRPAAEALEALASGVPPEQVELELIKKYPNEDIDMEDFLNQLNEMGFLVDEGDSVNVDEESHQNIEIKNSIYSSKIGRFLFHMWIIPIYVIMMCASGFVFILHPELFPQPRDLFPFDSMMLNIIVSMIISSTLLAIHESGHVLAAKAYGLPGKIRIGHRLFLVVLETEMPTIWRLPRGIRNIPLLAGLCMDHTILFLSLIASVFIEADEGEINRLYETLKEYIICRIA